eukprot:Gregarina_sp_Pseudo_9__910@NODE_1584_length_1478_cov_41_454482_g1469_i0_p1_GENE_NODE_1584_length_1478_cov_41_454482_g1469_i0NODE_1584_length_1478_cov_41_454482_g1469_i0_p1_ORF_typecomplete_len439_score107_15Asp_protease/PF09668_10/2_3e49gagasp_proteas/PF13975_6/7_4e14RVP_2/PF08284_11/1e11Asp_protease_2/PF13650_6/5_1e10UBA/PF00627_31/1_1e08RVP/PF00077_20/5_5e07ubiquitin/PF00240_23/1_6e06Peptidase_A2B/PF12384_8/4_5e05Peptidase_A2B/PF12384_8/1_8e03UN_NPL4/PF11543_8/7_4e05UN_NPL4/PF11543_8/6_8e03Ubi
MKISIINLATDDPPTMLECDPSTDIGTLKSLIEVETRVPYLRQRIILPGKDEHEIHEQDTLQALGVRDGDLITMADKGRSTSPTRTGEDADYTPLAHQLMEKTRDDPTFRRTLQERQPDLATAVASRDVPRVASMLRDAWRPRADMAARQIDPRALRALQDPMSPEAQQFMFERIRQEQIDQNFQFAQEYLPESFGQVAMLYVQIEVNNIPLRAFVDSGAQTTIMSEACASRCGLDRLIDRRYRGLAKGVGSARLTGRIHMAQIKCGGVYFPASFTIIENQQTDVLMGLDLLKRHQCCIDLKHHCLRIGEDTSVPFLSEAEVQQSLSDNMLRSLVDQNESVSAISDVDSSTMSVPPAGVPLVNLTGSRLPSVRSEANPQMASSAGTFSVGNRVIEETKIKALTDLGFTRDQALGALRNCNGNPELAAAMLFQSTGGNF